MTSFWVSSFTLLCLLLCAVTQDSNGDTSKGERCGGVPGIPGSPGSTGPAGATGRDGREGRDGRKGEKGELGSKGERGLPGVDGRPGDEGKIGLKGKSGIPGAKGGSGKTGPQGPKGMHGLKGSKGEVGGKGDKGEQSKLNWKQCVWKREDNKDAGLIQECIFKKSYGNTALHVAYAGTLRVYCPDTDCCSRWFFTFNDTECSGPTTIEGVVYLANVNDNPLRHRQIEGYCENIPAGAVKVGFHIGQCGGYSVADGDSGWNSVSRIMIAEVSSAQQ